MLSRCSPTLLVATSNTLPATQPTRSHYQPPPPQHAPELLCRRARRLRGQVLNLGLAKDDVGVRGGALVHVRLVDHKQDLRVWGQDGKRKPG